MSVTNGTQNCTTVDGGFKCGGCEKLLYSSTNANAGTSASVPFNVTCQSCISGYQLTASTVAVTLNGTAPTKLATSKCDLSIYCYKLPEVLPPSDITTALVIVIIMGVIACLCLGALVIFFFKRKPPMLAQQPKWPSDPNNASNMEHLKKDESHMVMGNGMNPTYGGMHMGMGNGMAPAKGGMPMDMGTPNMMSPDKNQKVHNYPDSPLQPEGPPKVSKPKTLRKRPVKGGGEP